MLKKMNPQDFDLVFSIMEESFPSDERRPYEGQKALLSNPKYHIYTLPDSKTRNLKGFITVWQFEDFVFIEHFAVNPLYRNQGLGSWILKELHSLLPFPLCLEVELPETDFARRRIAFYQRNGFLLNDYPYIQPSLSPGQNALPLMIMTSEGKITADRFEKIKAEIYKEVYHVTSL